MKRIVLPLLLSSAYVALLTLLFSSSFGKENNFLFENPEFSAFSNRLALPENITLTEETEAISELEVSQPEPAPASAGPSPESAPE